MKAPNSAFRERLKQAIESHDVGRIARLVEHLRFGCGANYPESYQVANEVSGISQPDWDELLYEADTAEANEG